MIYLENDQTEFPSPENARADGLLCVGGDLHPDRIEKAYRAGIFPWYEDGQPLLWWSPNPRMVLYPSAFKIAKSFRSKLNKHSFKISCDKDFKGVITHCADVPRKDQHGTWITDQMIAAYLDLHKKGFARSIEIWENDVLVGGLYGIDLPEYGLFCGESMFSLRPDASKIALHSLVEAVSEAAYTLIDCQMYTDHLYRLGAREIPRAEFLHHLKQPKKSFSAFSVSS